MVEKKERKINNSMRHNIVAPRAHFLLPPCPISITRMILPQVHLRKPCYDFSFL
jgi:hypothetical protein